MSRSPKDVLEMCEQSDVKIVDIRFSDLFGQWQHFSVPISQFSEDEFVEGYGFDGSSIRGWKAINESDMLVVPDPESAFLDPFTNVPTLCITGSIEDPITRQKYNRDPRNVARMAEEYLRSTGIGDTAYFGPEAEFFIFDDIRFADSPEESFFSIDSVEAPWNNGREEGPNLGHKIGHKAGYFPVAPLDAFQDLRSEMVLNLERIGIEVECQHHEVATAGQAEIDIMYNTLVRQADIMQAYKYVIKNTAKLHGKTVTFMPKPLFGDNGSGMHCHYSIWKDGHNIFAGEGYAGLSETALFAIGGILKHAGALVAFTNPTINSYKRLVPGFEAPCNLAYSSRNRSAAVRIPMYSTKPALKRMEFRCPDPTANPYLAFAAISMAALDGIRNQIDPGEPLDKDIYDLPPEEKANLASTPGSLSEALKCLEKDNEWLLAGDVFSEDLIRTWIDYKRENEIDPMRLRPHPYEFSLYYNI
jgi:glutamine synthetase